MFKLAVVVFALSMRIATGFSGSFTLQDSLLAGYTFDTLTGVDWLECIQKCVAHTRCLSYNYFKTQDEQAKKCELNEKAFDSMCDAQKHVITSPGWIYNQIKENVKTRGCGSSEGLPKPPGNVRGHNISSTSILVQWDGVPKADKKGIIKGYRVKYKALNISDNQTSKTVNGSERKEQALKGLNEFTKYNICVLAFTVQRDGPMNCTVVMTTEDRPGKPPSNVRGHNSSSKSILVQWDDVPQADQNGIIKGYRVTYRAVRKETAKQVNASGTRKTVLVELNEFTKYNICVLAFTVKGDGPMSCTDAMTAEDRPAKPPSNVRVRNISSTRILVQWDDVPQADQNGNIKGYRVKYRTGGGEIAKQVNGSGTRQTALEELNEFTEYNICVLAFTVKGDGPVNCTDVTTAEDRPGKPPSNVRGHNISSKSILVQWDDVPQADQNGIIIGYRVKYRTDGGKIGKQMNGSETRETVLVKLNEFTKYNICVLGFTVKGDGPVSCTDVMTAEDRPAKPPSNVQGHNISSTSILVQWDDVPQTDQNGIIKGYRVKYKALNTSEEQTSIIKGSDHKQQALEYLNELTNYNVCVLAFTVKGDGPESCILVVTAEDMITASITCDNLCTVYADGESLGEKRSEWTKVSKFTFPKRTKVIGIHGKDSDKPKARIGALIGSFSNGMVTNSGWKCSNTKSTGWSTGSFDDNAWPAAGEYGENGDAPWPWKRTFVQIAFGAKWIWTKDYENDDDVYCRIKVCLQ